MGTFGRNTVTSFRAQELLPDGSFRTAAFAFRGNEEKGYVVEREGRRHLELPAGYRLLKTLCCGICSTDQARPHLPFPLPQIIGHEVLAEDETGRLAAVEINASHAALGSPAARACSLCSSGLPTHCPDRMVLGIDRLPGGFGPYILAPRHCIVPVPRGMPPDTAVLVEPFAAALHAVETVGLANVETVGLANVETVGLANVETVGLANVEAVAVLGAGRLGLLVTAALEAVRATHRLSFSITVVEPNPLRAEKAGRLGADTVLTARDGCCPPDSADVVVEATGSPKGLEQALRMARREVHVKSTTGRPVMGLKHLTEMVVDEIRLKAFSREAVERLAASGGRQAIVFGGTTAGAEKILASCGLAVRRLAAGDVPAGTDLEQVGSDLEQVGIVVVSSLEDADRALRPWTGREQGLVRPRGVILIEKQGRPSGLLTPLFAKNLSITTSRCGSIRKAFIVMTTLMEQGVNLGEILVTHHVPAGDLGAAMALAGQPGAVKVVVEQVHV